MLRFLKVLGIVFYHKLDSCIAVDEQTMLLSQMFLMSIGLIMVAESYFRQALRKPSFEAMM